MEKERAIKILRCLIGDEESPLTGEECKDKEYVEQEYDDAIKMAIDALEKNK